MLLRLSTYFMERFFLKITHVYYVLKKTRLEIFHNQPWYLFYHAPQNLWGRNSRSERLTVWIFNDLSPFYRDRVFQLQHMQFCNYRECKPIQLSLEKSDREDINFSVSFEWRAIQNWDTEEVLRDLGLVTKILNMCKINPKIILVCASGELDTFQKYLDQWESVPQIKFYAFTPTVSKIPWN